MSKEEYTKLYRKLRKIEKLLIGASNIPLPLKRALRYTGFSKSHLYKLTHSQAIPYYKPEGKKIYFLKSDLDEYLLRNRISTKAEIEAKATHFGNPFKTHF